MSFGAESNPLLSAALRYASLGFPVFPIKPRGKKPLLKGGFHTASVNPGQIEQWWTRQWPNANIGIPTGQASGLIVVDVDPRNGGDDTLEVQMRTHGMLPKTLTQLTGGRGTHYLFRDPGMIIRSRILGDGLELKGDGSYILVAPSIHPSGEAYSWDTLGDEWEELRNPALLPIWLVGPPERERKPKAIGPVGKGARNSYLASCGGAMRARGFSETAIRGALLEMNQELCRPPLPVAEVEKVAHSVARYAPSAEILDLSPLPGLEEDAPEPIELAPAEPAEPVEPAAAAPAPAVEAPEAAAAPTTARAKVVPIQTVAMKPVPSQQNGRARPTRAQILEWLAQQLQFPIENIVKVTSEEPSWKVMLSGGREVEFATTADMLDQARMRVALVSKTNQLMRRFTAKAWDAVVAMMLEIVTEVEPMPEETVAGELAMLIDEYLSTTAFVEVLELRSISDQNGPCVWEGEVAITIFGLRNFLLRRAPQSFRGPRILSHQLREIGAVRTRTHGWALRVWRWVLPAEMFTPERYHQGGRNARIQ